LREIVIDMHAVDRLSYTQRKDFSSQSFPRLSQHFPRSLSQGAFPDFPRPFPNTFLELWESFPKSSGKIVGKHWEDITTCMILL